MTIVNQSLSVQTRNPIRVAGASIRDPDLGLAMTTTATHDKQAGRSSRRIRKRRATTSALRRHAFLVVDRAAGRARFSHVMDRGIQVVVVRDRPPDRSASCVAAAHDRFVRVVRLLKDRRVRAATDRSGDADASVIDYLDAYRTRHQQAANERPLVVKPRLDWLVDVAVVQLRASPNPDVRGDDDHPISPSNNTSVIR
jgi:hypothetical protein